MCSIIGYRGGRKAVRVLINGLRNMEYRGYDSVGVATMDGAKIQVRKRVGRVDDVSKAMGLDELGGTSGVGHTRWATQGAPTDRNAHPHVSSGGRVAIVHNGTIENFAELRTSLESQGFSFKSETDSEVIANLLESELDGGDGVRGAVLRTIAKIRGHYTFAAIFNDGSMAATRRRESLIVGVGDGEYYVSSDVHGFVEYANDVIYVNDGDVVVIDDDGLGIYDGDGRRVTTELTKVSRELATIYKEDYAHHTLKEISEQPDVIGAAGADESAVSAVARSLRDAGTVYIVGSGTSYNAALAAKHLLLEYASIRAEAIVASEIPVHARSLERGGIMLAISQSGESADVLEAAGIARNAGIDVISIVNHPNSALARESTDVIRINCGPEIGVAATKSFLSQLVVLYKIVGELGGPGIDQEVISQAISGALESGPHVKEIARRLRDVNDVYVLGRGIHYAIALEAALKLKELTYIHAEAMPGGELKHGPLALLDEDTNVIIINPPGTTHDDALADAAKIRARGAHVIGIDTADSDAYDDWIPIPESDEAAHTIAEIVPIQLLAYYTALERDTNPDRPRNLAKSVTVR